MENTWKEPSRASRVYTGRLRAFLMLWRGGGLPLTMAATSRGLYQMLGGRSVVKPALGGTQGGRRRRRGQRKGGRAQWQMRQSDPWARRHVGEGALTGGTDEMGMEGGAFATLCWSDELGCAQPVPGERRRRDVGRRFRARHVPPLLTQQRRPSGPQRPRAERESWRC